MNGVSPGAGSFDRERYIQGMEFLVGVVQKLSLARELDAVVEIVRHAARELTGADGATFVLREQDRCYYVDEDAIGPLWKGRRFPMSACISGWSMLNRQSAVIEDIYQDERIPADAYRPTFVKSLVMVPIRSEEPIGAIGNYWARPHRAAPEEVSLLQALADSTSIALENIELYGDLRRSLDETRAARDELERQLHLRDEFISICAHELKTPLTPLAIQAQFMERMLKAGELRGHRREGEIARFIGVSVRQVSDFTRLIENLLDVSRIRLGHFTFRLEPGVDLGEIVEKIATEHRMLGASEIRTDLQSGLKGQWDSLRLEQAIRNLMSNAVKYGDRKPVEVSAREQGDGRVRIVVRDQGPGIAKEDQERIFERFERATSMRKYGGLGLGLFITRQIIQGMGGTIRVESEPGHGAAFIAEIPVSQERTGALTSVA